MWNWLTLVRTSGSSDSSSSQAGKLRAGCPGQCLEVLKISKVKTQQCLCHCFVICTVKKLFLVSRWNLSFFQEDDNLSYCSLLDTILVWEEKSSWAQKLSQSPSPISTWLQIGRGCAGQSQVLPCSNPQKGVSLTWKILVCAWTVSWCKQFIMANSGQQLGIWTFLEGNLWL